MYHIIFYILSKKVPVYDAQKVSQDIQVDFEYLDGSFPRFDGGIPVGSCVAVGHGVSSYIGMEDDVEKFGTKLCLAFVVVFGSPPA